MKDIEIRDITICYPGTTYRCVLLSHIRWFKTATVYTDPFCDNGTRAWIAMPECDVPTSVIEMLDQAVLAATS